MLYFYIQKVLLSHRLFYFHRWSKTAKSLPDTRRLTTSYSRELSLLDDDDSASIPYRLPRITPRDDLKHDLIDDHKVFSRFGYEPALR